MPPWEVAHTAVEVAYGQDMPASFQQPDRRDIVAELMKESSKVGGRAGVGLGGGGRIL